MTAVPGSDRAAVLAALRHPDAADGVDTITVLRLTGMDSSTANPALERLVDDGEVENWWTDGNPRVRMYRAARWEQA